MKLSHLLIAGLLSSSLIASASTGDDKLPNGQVGTKKNKKCDASTSSATKTTNKKVKTAKEKSVVVNIKKADVCETCGRG